MASMEADFAFDAPSYANFGSQEQDDNADAWFDTRRVTRAAASKMATPVAHGKTSGKTPGRAVPLPVFTTAPAAAAATGAATPKEAKAETRTSRKRAREPVVMPVRSEAPLTIPTTPEVLKKARSRPVAEKYVSVAECVAQFSARTPPRFHVAPAQAKFRPTRAQGRRGVTRARSPKFQPRRQRPRTVLSAEEKEEVLMKEIRPFKSQPVSRDVLESKGDLGVPRIPTRDVTVPKEFNFATQKRAELRPKTAVEEEEHIVHANPIPADLFAPRPLSAPRAKRGPTIPVSPNITKPAPRPEPVEEEPPLVEFHAQPMPSTDAVFRPTLPHTHTEPAPFSVADKNPMVTRARLLEQAKEEEARLREFKAHGIPDYESLVEVPVVLPRPTTTVQPFALAGEEISGKKMAEFKSKLAEEQERQERERVFHAQPCAAIFLAPFEAKRSDRPLTQINAFDFPTDKRAAERGVFEEHLKDRARQEEAEREWLERERQEQEKKEVAAMRKARETKANPIRKFKDVAPPKTLPLTEPHTPRLSKRIRT